MARNTPLEYRSQVLYSVYVRNHTQEGTFEGVRRDLKRIKDLGVDMIWLLPIHPIGVEGHKGSLGCPYAIRDYRAVNPEYGTLEDLKALVADCHRLGMKCIIDVVYNHTSPDSVLAHDHPEWFYHKADGSLGGRVGDWSDVVDLDYSHPELWDYQIETLKYWAGIVDGFRCDVASMVPLDFWLRAREEVETVHPGTFWLAESVHPHFIAEIRGRGYQCSSDAELYQAFDATYEYDIFPTFQACLEGKAPLEKYVEELNRQEIVYPGNYVKLRYLENHDQLRAAFLLPDETIRRNWTALLYFRRGMTLIYGGQEAGATHLPSLFDREPVDWSGPDCSHLLRALARVKAGPLVASGAWGAQVAGRGILRCSYRNERSTLTGIFSLEGNSGAVAVEVPDGVYADRITGQAVEVKMGMVRCDGTPLIFETTN